MRSRTKFLSIHVILQILSDPLRGIAEAAREMNADYTRHSLAAREIARQFFEAEKVLRSLLERAGI